MTQVAQDERVQRLYEDFSSAGLLPLWTQREGLMPSVPEPAAMPHHWPWAKVFPLAERAGELVPVGRGGERRAIAYSNPGLPGLPYATPTLWAAVQYLGPHEVAPAHRHTQGAFRFVLEGEGVWTVVDGDPVAMRRGDLLLTPGWSWHEHHNTAERPMVWLDGLDIPLVSQLDGGFFEFGPDTITDSSTPRVSRSESLWAYPGLRPLGVLDTPNSPLAAYRWEYTDAALDAQFDLEREGSAGVVEPGHAAVRFVNPTNGRDALVTMRTEMHRLAAGAVTTPRRQVGSAVWQVFEGSGMFEVGSHHFDVVAGDVVAVPSWACVRVLATSRLDLFMFSDMPVFEALNLHRSKGEESGGQE